MDQRNTKILGELMKKSGNSQCADCGSKDVEYASYNIGILLCSRCAQIHLNMGSHVSKPKHLKLDHWEDSQVERLKQVGNLVAKGKYEARVPVGFRRPAGFSQVPCPTSTDPPLLLEHWIVSKYVREEFICSTGNNNDQQDVSSPLRPYLLGNMDSFLMKKGREDVRFFPRRFVLDPTTLRYYVKEKSNPKAVIKLVELDVSLSPQKLKHPYSLQLSYLNHGSTRHLYVYHDDPELVCQWYHAIRISKLNALKHACSSGKAPVYVQESTLVSMLPHDSGFEGYLWKAGPSPSYAHRRRWFTLNNRKLMYHIEALDAYPKGEIFLGSNEPVDQGKIESQISVASKVFDVEIKASNVCSSITGYKVTVGGFGDDKMDPQRWVFSLHTPYRTFILAAETQLERDKWVSVLDFTLRHEINPRDIATCSQLVRKRNGSVISNPLSGLLSSSSSSSPITSAVNTTTNSSTSIR
ncbi:unnamed protein product [Orchesella dallaii]|uniref:Arf-GAP with dual PH domain-containing protein 1 n=1 Tax=Orchesella dallaii TaxID=48710 RepID=A0ABP1RE88_9HEXA